MALTENHNLLEELTPTAGDPAFGGPVLPRTAVGGANRLCAHRLNEPDHGGAEYGVAVKDEVSRRRVVWEMPRVVAESPTPPSGGT